MPNKHGNQEVDAVLGSVLTDTKGSVLLDTGGSVLADTRQESYPQVFLSHINHLGGSEKALKKDRKKDIKKVVLTIVSSIT